MKRIARVALILGAVLYLVACGGGQAPVTKIGDDVQSYCIESRSERASYRDFCDATRACKSADITKANQLAKQGTDFCKSNPSDTAANRATIKGIVAEQRTVGYAQ